MIINVSDGETFRVFLQELGIDQIPEGIDEPRPIDCLSEEAINALVAAYPDGIVDTDKLPNHINACKLCAHEFWLALLAKIAVGQFNFKKLPDRFKAEVLEKTKK